MLVVPSELFCTLLLAAASAVTPPGMTEYQKALQKTAFPKAVTHSRAAEAELLEVFASSAYRHEMNRLGDTRLAAMTPNESLEELKRAMSSTEFGTAFGLDAAMRAKWPGMSSPNISTIADWGYYPNSWQLKYYNSSLVANMPENQWNLYDGGEVGLYNLKGFAHPSAHRPTWAETAERPTYCTINQRRLDTGNEMFGAYTMIYRGSVVRERAVIIPSDSGEWQNACNKSIHTPRKWWWAPIEHFLYHCAEFGEGFDQPGWHPIPIRMDAWLHSVIPSAKIMSQSVPRLLGQMLSPKAGIDPIEINLYPEAAILGAVQMTDLKTLVAAFTIFGTEDGDEVVAFCRRFRLPLAWGLGWSFDRTNAHWWNQLPPPLGGPTMPAGRARILDIRTVEFTNSTTPSSEARSLWKHVEDEVRAYKSSNPKQDFGKIDAYWKQLSGAQTTVQQLRGTECEDTDLCFGTDNAGDCICRRDPDEKTVVV